MRPLFFFLLTIWWQHPAQAQDCTISNGHAYQRSTIAGKNPGKDLNESGKQIEEPVKKMNTFFIYVETKTNCSPSVTRLWIDGKPYNTIQEAIQETPILVQSSHPGGEFDTLVKKTKNKVFRIHPREELSVKPGKDLANRLARAKIILEYTGSSRTRYFEIQNIKRIAPIVLQ